MNKKGNVGFVFVVIFGIILSGFLLNVFSPTINEFRLDLIEDLNESTSEANILLKIIIYGIIPYMWFMYIFLSIFFLIYAVNIAARDPFGGL